MLLEVTRVHLGADIEDPSRDSMSVPQVMPKHLKGAGINVCGSMNLGSYGVESSSLADCLLLSFPLPDNVSPRLASPPLLHFKNTETI